MQSFEGLSDLHSTSLRGSDATVPAAGLSRGEPTKRRRGVGWSSPTTASRRQCHGAFLHPHPRSVTNRLRDCLHRVLWRKTCVRVKEQKGSRKRKQKGGREKGKLKTNKKGLTPVTKRGSNQTKERKSHVAKALPLNKGT